MAKKKGGQGFVLDGSVSVAWFFEDESSTYAEAVESALITVSAYVPTAWCLEVANALLVGERRKCTTEAKTNIFFSLLKRLPIVVDEETQSRAWQESMQIARRHDLSVYDAAYLELALRRGLPIASLDSKLKSAAAVVGVPEFKP